MRPDGLGLSRARARELRLAHAWRLSAGEALARNARVTLRRGVLEVIAVDAGWQSAVAPLMPRIAARVARRSPELGIDAWRLDDGALCPLDPSAADDPDTAVPAETLAADPPDTEGPDAPERPGMSVERLERVARRYADRVRTRSEG